MVKQANFWSTCLKVVFLGLAPTFVGAQSALPLNNVDVAAHRVYGPAQQHRLINDLGVPGGQALRVTVNGATAEPWSAGLSSIIQSSLAKGDRLETVIMLRMAPDGTNETGSVKIAFQMNEAPYTEFATSTVRVKREWTAFGFRARAPRNLDPSKSRIALQLGYGQQSIDVGPILVTRPVR
jgi:hypothetical protein